VEIVVALTPVGGFPNSLDGRDQKPYQDSNDCQSYEQLDQGETKCAFPTKAHDMPPFGLEQAAASSPL
jgi:hypothetical protein